MYIKNKIVFLIEVALKTPSVVLLRSCSRSLKFSPRALYLAFLRSLLIILFLSISCSQEDQPYHKIPEISFGGCLNGVSENLKNYYYGELTKSELHEFWNCAENILIKFVTKGHGKSQKDAYSITELKKYLVKHVLKSENGHVSDELLFSLMEIKKLFLGGNSKFITKKEVYATLNLINRVLEPVSEDLRPHMKNIFSFVRDEKVLDISETERQAAFKKLNESLQKIANVIAWNEIEYEFSSLQVLVKELYSFIYPNSDKIHSSRASHIVKLIAELKNIIIGGGNERIQKYEWNLLNEWAVKSLEMASRVTFLLNSNFKEREKLNSLSKGVEEIFSYLDEIYKNRKIEVIANTDIYKLISAMEAAGLFSNGLEADDIYEIWLVSLNKFFKPDQGDFTSGLFKDHLVILKQEWQKFAEIHTHLVNRNDDQLPKTKNWQNFKQAIDSPWGYITDSQGRTIFQKPLVRGNHNLESKLNLNWESQVVQLIINAYSENNKGQKEINGLTEDELKVAYEDLKVLLVLLGLVKKDDTNFYKKVFQEANLFMPRSDGDKKIDFAEGVEYIHFVFAGIAAGDYLVAQVSSHCEVITGMGLNGVYLECFKNWFKKNFYLALGHMPEFYNSFLALSEDKKETLQKSLQKIVRDENSSHQLFLTSDLKEMMVLLQYTETLMFRFDSNGDGVLNVKEALRGFPLIAPTLGRLIGLDVTIGEDFEYLEALYTYMLKYGGIPDLNHPVEGLRFLHWRWHKPTWRLEADRVNITQILASLKRAI